MPEFDLTKLISAIQHALFDERLYFGKETGIWDTETANAYHGWCLRNNVAPYMARQQPTSLATTEPNLARLIASKVNVSLAARPVNQPQSTPVTVEPAPIIETKPEPAPDPEPTATDSDVVDETESEQESEVAQTTNETAQNPNQRFKKHRR